MNMKRSIGLFICISLLCMFFAIPVFAQDSRLIDNADILNASEEVDLQNRLDSISEKYEIDVVVLTVHDIGNKTPMDFADDYYDYHEYGYGEERDGLLLLVSMETGDWWISTSGKAIEIFDDYTIDYVGNKTAEYLSEGNYKEAFDVFADECEYYIDGELNGYPFSFGFNLTLSAIVGLIVALIATSVMKGKLKNIHLKNTAGDYVKEGSMVVSISRDLYLYSTVTRVAKPKNNSSSGSTHRSSSGRTHGGGGGKF